MCIRNRALSLVYKILLLVLCGLGLLLYSGLLEGNFDVSVFSYFTIAVNCLCFIFYFASVISLIADLARRGVRGINSFGIHFKGALIVAMCAVVALYLLVLPAVFNTTGGAVANFTPANFLVYLIVPAMVLADWLLFDKKGWYRPSDPIVWLLIPYLYYAFVLVRAQFGVLYLDGSSYPYSFINADQLGWAKVLANIGFLSLLFLAAGYILFAIDAIWGSIVRKKLKKKHQEAAVLSEKTELETPSGQLNDARESLIAAALAPPPTTAEAPYYFEGVSSAANVQEPADAPQPTAPYTAEGSGAALKYGNTATPQETPYSQPALSPLPLFSDFETSEQPSHEAQAPVAQPSAQHPEHPFFEPDAPIAAEEAASKTFTPETAGQAFFTSPVPTASTAAATEVAPSVDAFSAPASFQAPAEAPSAYAYNNSFVTPAVAAPAAASTATAAAAEVVPPVDAFSAPASFQAPAEAPAAYAYNNSFVTPAVAAPAAASTATAAAAEVAPPVDAFSAPASFQVPAEAPSAYAYNNSFITPEAAAPAAASTFTENTWAASHNAEAASFTAAPEQPAAPAAAPSAVPQPSFHTPVLPVFPLPFVNTQAPAATPQAPETGELFAAASAAVPASESSVSSASPAPTASTPPAGSFGASPAGPGAPEQTLGQQIPAGAETPAAPSSVQTQAAPYAEQPPLYGFAPATPVQYPPAGPAPAWQNISPAPAPSAPASAPILSGYAPSQPAQPSQTPAPSQQQPWQPNQQPAPATEPILPGEENPQTHQ